MLFFCPDKERLAQDISEHIAKFKQGRAVKENIEKYFEDPYAKSPTFIMAGTGGSAMRTLIPDIRQDAYERIISLITES